MVKYSLFILIASIWLFTLLCVNAESASVPGDQAGTDADHFNGNLETAFQALSNIEQSPNVFLKLFRYTAKKFIDYFEKDKTFIQDAVNKGTEMEKKIQSISHTLKNSTVTLPAEFQSELQEIEKHAAAELKKLKGVEDVKDIEEMHKRYNTKYAEFKKQIEAMSKLALSAIEKHKTEQAQKRAANTQASQAKNQKEIGPFVDEAKKLIIDFITTSVPVAFTIKKDTETISKKKNVASSALSKIRNDLIKVEQMEYHLLGAYKNLSKTDVSYFTCSFMVQFAFAIMFGMIF